MLADDLVAGWPQVWSAHSMQIRITCIWHLIRLKFLCHAYGYLWLAPGACAEMLVSRRARVSVGGQRLRVMSQVVSHEGLDEVVAVVVTGMAAQYQGLTKV
jgi:hypothetical protein